MIYDYAEKADFNQQLQGHLKLKKGIGDIAMDEFFRDNNYYYQSHNNSQKALKYKVMYMVFIPYNYLSLIISEIA